MRVQTGRVAASFRNTLVVISLVQGLEPTIEPIIGGNAIIGSVCGWQPPTFSRFPRGLKNGDGGGTSATDFLAASVLSDGVAPTGASGAATRLIDFDLVTPNHASIRTREGGGRIGRSAQSLLARLVVGVP